MEVSVQQCLKLYRHHFKEELKKKSYNIIDEKQVFLAMQNYSALLKNLGGGSKHQTYWSSVRIEDVFTLVVRIMYQRTNYLHIPIKYWTLIDFVFSFSVFTASFSASSTITNCIHKLGKEDSWKLSQLTKATERSRRVQVSLTRQVIPSHTLYRLGYQELIF